MGGILTFRAQHRRPGTALATIRAVAEAAGGDAGRGGSREPGGFVPPTRARLPGSEDSAAGHQDPARQLRRLCHGNVYRRTVSHHSVRVPPEVDAGVNGSRKTWRWGGAGGRSKNVAPLATRASCHRRSGSFEDRCVHSPRSTVTVAPAIAKPNPLITRRPTRTRDSETFGRSGASGQGGSRGWGVARVSLSPPARGCVVAKSLPRLAIETQTPRRFRLGANR